MDNAPAMGRDPATDKDSAPGGIRIRHLYKIFGPSPRSFLAAVQGGMSKAELNEKHGHVLGLCDINIDIPAGGIQVVMGLSGSGKSTLIRHINRLIEPSAGEILVGDADVVKMSHSELREFRRQRTAMVFQNFALLPHRTVLDNVVYGLEIRGVARAEQEKAARRWIERVGLQGFEGRYPRQLSGGMQQRVGLARALANDAPILLMDEAFSALDPLIRMDMQSVLLDLQKEIRKTIVFITHDLDEALRLGDHIAILRDGAIVQQGSGQDIVLRPADSYISTFVKEVNRGRVIRVESVMSAIDGAEVAGALSIPVGSVIEDAAKLLTEGGQDSAIVADANGRPIGRVDMRTIVAAMVTPVSRP